MPEEMDKQYNPAAFEERLYARWEELGLFHAEVDPDRPPYTIMIPPPNVTGVLHMGHGLNNTIQDVLIRYHRMRGYNTLWMPGTDHAGIATQNVVERKLAKEGKKRHDLGREAFLEEVWKFKEAHRDTIKEQLRKLGSSCDWERERFTMDEGLSRAVLEVFVALHEKDLVYRGEYIINWCPRCTTALSDEEAEHEEIDGTFTHIRYPFVDGSGEVIVATTRPETMLGDTAVAVHPDDPRYKDAIGKMLVLPLTGREIPLVADYMVDREFGTGAVKVTPAHDPNDFETGNRHKLPRLNVMTETGLINDNAPQAYRGLDRFACRKKIVEDLKEQGFFVKQDAHRHAVGHCYRCHTVVEPYLSKQWFVRMAPLAGPATKAVDDGKIVFYPERWKKVYLNWMTNIRDWCISRQIWWGHQIPAWYAVSETGGRITADSPCFVARDEAGARALAEAKFGRDVVLERDPDVLDTWFSSWLWPFSTLGWPGKTPELAHFYPTSVLSTDMGIIFFWVARMIMAGYFCTGELPFRDVYIHGTVMDEHGKKMSKSKGNGIDPLDVIREYGADALRYTMIAITPQGQNTLLSMDKFKIGSRFANKVWNASRYILMNIDDTPRPAIADVALEPEDRWILSRLERTALEVAAALAEYRLNDAATGISHFVWDDFCDWYIEFTKLRLYADDAKRKGEALALLLHVLEQSLRLLHPFMPFITEEIYLRLPGAGEALVLTRYPEGDGAKTDAAVEAQVALVQELVTGIRNVRAEMRVPPEKKAPVIVKPADAAVATMLAPFAAQITALARVTELSFDQAASKPDAAAAGVGKGYEFYLPLAGLIDLDAERARLAKELERQKNELAKIEAKLADAGFTGRAPEAVVAREREKVVTLTQTIAGLAENLRTMG